MKRIMPIAVMAATAEILKSELTPSQLVKGGHYNWMHQKERLVYLGRASGWWHQFALVDDDTKKVWCEVLAEDLRMMEVTP